MEKTQDLGLVEPRTIDDVEDKFKAIYGIHHTEVDTFIPKDKVFLDNDIGLANAYDSPDRKQYVITDMHCDVYVMYSNNIVMPVRKLTSISRSLGLKSELMKKHKTGIYIVEYYKLLGPNNNKQINTKINTYYSKYGNYIYNGKDEILQRIASMDRDEFYPGLFNERWLRIVTFIPDAMITTHSAVHVPNTGLVVGNATLCEERLHPSNDKYSHYVKSLVSDAKNFIEIDIIDNVGEGDYYVKVGHQVVKLRSTQDYTQTDKAMYTIYSNKIPVDVREATPSTMQEVLGIYPTPREAELNGDLNKQTEIKKLENEMRKIELDKEKLEYEKNKLQLELDKMALEIEKLKKEKEKLEFEKELEKARYVQEMNKIELKNKTIALDTNKVEMTHQLKILEHNQAVQKIGLDARMILYKWMVDTKAMKMELMARGYKNQLDLDKDAIKLTNDEIRYAKDNVNTGANIIGSTIKFVTSVLG